MHRLVGRFGRPVTLLAPVEMGHDVPSHADRLLLVLGEVVGETGDLGVHLGSAELLVCRFLTGRHLDQRGAAEEHLGPVLDHHRVVAHGGEVGAPCGRAAEDEATVGIPCLERRVRLRNHFPPR